MSEKSLWDQAFERVFADRCFVEEQRMGRALTTAEWEEVKRRVPLHEVAQEHELLCQMTVTQLKEVNHE
jgi:hypothetical protein